MLQVFEIVFLPIYSILCITCERTFLRGSSAKFYVGVCHPQLQNGTVDKTNFCKNDSYPWLGKIFHQKCHELAFSDKSCQIFALSRPKSPKSWVSVQELPKFDFSLTKIAKELTLAQTKIAKKYTLGQIRSLKKYTLPAGTSPGTFTMKEQPPGGNSLPSNIN